MSRELTGKTRHRPLSVGNGILTVRRTLLVMEVETKNTDFDQSPYPTLWRDARVEDLAELARMGKYPEAL